MSTKKATIIFIVLLMFIGYLCKLLFKISCCIILTQGFNCAYFTTDFF